MRILWISDSVSLSTGFGTQSLTICRGLQGQGHEIQTLGWGVDTERKHEGIPVYPLYGSFSNIRLILQRYYAFEPDIVISYGDIHMVQHMIVDIRDSSFKDKWIHWLPVDGDPYPDKHDVLYKELRHLVIASQFGEDVFRGHFDGNISTIYNAIDPNEFYPIENRNEMKKPDGLRDKFVCLFVGMNQGRKKIPLLIEGFAKFARDKDDVVLVMHTQPHSLRPTYQGWDIPSLLKRAGLSDKKALISSDVISTAKLNKLYNCSTIFVSATGGEGFNLPAAEAMMSGMPLILPNFTTGPEFIGDGEDSCGDLIDISEYVHEGPLSIRKAIINTDDLAKKLEYMYIDWKTGGHQIMQMGQTARKRALDLFSTPKIVKKWDQKIMDAHKKATIKQISVVKSLRGNRRVVFLDDMDPNSWIGGTQLSTQKIVEAAKEFGIEAICTTIDNCELKDLHSSDMIVLNNIHETAQRSPGLMQEIISNTNYIKWEHDFNFCNTRDFKCGGIEQDCQKECKVSFFSELYNNARSVVFQSPLHYKTFANFFGEKIIGDHLILPPPIDPDPFVKAGEEAQNRQDKYLWTGLLHPFRGIEEALEYAEGNPHKRFLFHSAYPPKHKKYVTKIEELPNCEHLHKAIPYNEMPELYASCSHFMYQPRGIDASSRATLEAFLAGCQLRPNHNVGLMSYDWLQSNREEIVEVIKAAPKLFWEHVSEHMDASVSDSPKIKNPAKVNIVFFPSGTSSGKKHLPSSHIRVYRVSEELKKIGYDVQVIDSDIPDEMKYSALSNLRPNDIVYVQKTFAAFNKAENFKHVKGNNVIIYDVDDYYPERNKEGKIQYMYNSDNLAMLADMVIVGSHRLQQVNRKNNRNIKIIPSLVDDELYQYKPREVKDPHQIRILWTEKDGRVYIDDLMMIKEPLDEIHKQYSCQLILQAFQDQEIQDIQDIFPYARVLPVTSFKDYVEERVPMMAACDFFIAPFSPDSERYKEKSFKAGQNSRHMMGMGLPGVASPTGEHDHFIEDGVNGFLAKTDQEWFDKIEELVTNNPLRVQMGYKSREVIEKNYTIDRTIRKVVESVNSIKMKYYKPSIELSTNPQYKALVTIKYGSSGGGTMTSKHIRDILENIGYKTQLLHCAPHRGSRDNYVHQINEQRLKTPILLREYAQKYPVDVIFFDDVPRYEKDVARLAPKAFLVLCGCANVHEEYVTNPTVLSGVPHVDRVFVKNYCLHKFLNSMFGDKFVYWQGGIDAQALRNRHGRARYRDPTKDGVLLTSSFSHGWWKNPTMATLAAYAIYKKFPRTKYFKPILRNEDLAFYKHTQFKILGNSPEQGPMPREQLIDTLAQGQLGLEVYLADAFPRTLLDYFALGVPLITSSTITFLNEFPLLRENLVVENPNDPLAITQKALNLLEDQEKWEVVSAACIEFTSIYSFQAESDVLIKYAGLRVPDEIASLDTGDFFLHEEELETV